jgi:hypothetical protein
MSYLYDVYTQSKRGYFGVAIANGKVHTAEVSAEGKLLKSREIAPEQLATEISKRVRSGFTKVSRAKYLEVTGSAGEGYMASFVDHQPEIGHKDVVCYSPVGLSDDTEAVAGELEKVLLDAGVADFNFRQCLERIKRARGYMAIRDELPELVLVFADWSIRNNRILLSRASGIPTRAPKDDPAAWEAWLLHSFTESETRNALEKLGWSMRQALLAPMAQGPEQSATSESEPLVLF